MQHLTLSALVLAAVPTIGTATSGHVDCSQYQQSANVDAVQARFTSILDHKVGPNGYLHAEITFPGQGWIGFGYSANGNMVPGYAVIGLPGLPNSSTNPGKYNMGGEYVGAGGVYLMDNSMQTLTNASVTSNATHTMMKFTKRLEESGDLTINGKGSNNFLVAYGDTTNTLSYHTYRNNFVFNLQSCVNGAVANSSSSSGSVTVDGSSTPNKKLWTAHGVFAAVAWGVLAPIAIAASMLRKFFNKCHLPSIWFTIHQTLGVTVLIFTIISFAFAVRATTLDGDPHFKGLQHRTTGLVIMILVFLQVVMGIFRPHRPNHPNDHNETESKDSAEEIRERDEENDDEQANTNDEKQHLMYPKKSVQRVVFEAAHRLLGFGLLGFTWWQVQNGFWLYSQDFSEKDLSDVFWGIAGGITGIILILFIIMIALRF